MNSLSKGLQEESENLFREKIIGNTAVKAVLFISSKSDNFIVGANIDELRDTPNKSDLKDMCMRGHNFFNEVKSKAKVPFLAAINGSALGGGLEWAMYCDYRIATTAKKTVLGLPEVQIGLLPGMAGTYHLPKLVGYQTALDMILTGKHVKADRAKRLGLVDMVVDPAALEEVAINTAKAMIAGKVKPTKRKRDWLSFALEVIPYGRNYMFDQAKKMVDKNTGGKYPAPYRILSVLQDNYGKSKMEHLENEAKVFSELAATPESAALIGIFKGSSAVKKHDYGSPKHQVQNIAVLGAGLMGAGIAQVSAEKGEYRVFMKDRDLAAVSRGEKMIEDDLKSKMKKRRMTSHEYCSISSRIYPLHDGVQSWRRHLNQADLVIEAVFEEIGVKHAVLKEMEDIIPKHCIFASNTSAIPISQIAQGAAIPERVIGMHYFSPVPKMPLLEIITHAGTAPEVAAAAMEVGSKQGKTPIFVKDVAGFYVNRCLGPFMSEVTALVHEGVDLMAMDKAMKSFGMPVGPVTLCDEVGVDISAHVGAFMAQADLGVRMEGGANVFPKMLEKGWLGRKTGKGFYLYPKNAKKGDKKELNPELVAMLKADQVKDAIPVSEEDIQMRIISRFVNEAAFSLQDGVIRSAVDGDIGAVFGIGFPPFLGGPFRMVDHIGARQFVDRMLRYRDWKGPQFEPCQLLKDYASSGKKFHP
eukprot:CAMPEP_0182428424 /NCGR_PEP_ID=MMETSP1167-20130531/23019_1 /TAXON_ID=2988 /ORGANISM="Mallomonas Sp, Strain CCMP3275" /LENGTH=697 /DNA_ID=CAMNT_0024611343 /DNA_START=267 /DNA_END=2360 /DNA_ORIENTATION=+